MPRQEQDHLSSLGPDCSLWKGREELLLSRRRSAEQSYFSYSFLKSPKKQLVHRSPSWRALGAEGERITSLCS